MKFYPRGDMADEYAKQLAETPDTSIELPDYLKYDYEQRMAK